MCWIIPALAGAHRVNPISVDLTQLLLNLRVLPFNLCLLTFRYKLFFFPLPRGLLWIVYLHGPLNAWFSYWPKLRHAYSRIPRDLKSRLVELTVVMHGVLEITMVVLMQPGDSVFNDNLHLMSARPKEQIAPTGIPAPERAHVSSQLHRKSSEFY